MTEEFNFMQRFVGTVILLVATTSPLSGQTPDMQSTISPSASSPVPLLVRFSGTLREVDGTLASGPRGVTFSLYEEQTSGDPLWTESQTISADNLGRFTVLLGSASSLGIPSATFATGEPRWIGITPIDGIERPRIALVSVPYALKAADADTIGGKSSAEFVSLQQLTAILGGFRPVLPNPVQWPSAPLPCLACRMPTFSQALGYEATSPIGPSFISIASNGPPFEVVSDALVSHLNVDLLHGFTDAAFAKVSSSNIFSEVQILMGGIELPPASPDSSTAGALDSAPLDFESSVTNPQTNSSIMQRFRWVSQPVLGTTTPAASAQLSFLFGAGGTNPTNTGLSINADGTINFAPGQNFPINGMMGSGNGGGGGISVGAGSPVNPIVNSAVYTWTQIPSAKTAIQPGLNSVILTPCPRGVNGTDAWHYLYVSGTGTPEMILITGGSCISRASSGTIDFTAVYSHPVGYTIGTATAGVQEAVVDAQMPNTNGQVSRQVMIDPGGHLFRARLSIRGTGMTVTSSGATITCAMSDTCIMMGDPSDSNLFASITVSGLRIIPGVQKGTWPAVEDNANGSTIVGLSPGSGVAGANFGSLIQIDNDQAATINNLNTVTNYSWARCDLTFCSTAILGPGPFSKNAGVLWVQNSNITLQGTGNGIDNQNGNTLQVSNSVVQGYSQFGIRALTIYQPVAVQLNGVYFEDDSDANPLGTGAAGLIVEGGQAGSSASTPAGVLPLYANTGNTQYLYYIVVNSSTYGTSPLYLAGSANTSGSGLIKVLWNQVGTEGVITYDVLRIVGPVTSVAPYGTGLYAIATGVPATTACLNKVCSIMDNAGAPPYSYTIQGGGYWPSLKLWPGSVILTSANDFENSGGGVPTEYFTDSLSEGAMVSSAGGFEPSVFAQQCNPQTYWTPILIQCVGGNAVSNDYQPVGATLLQQSVNGGGTGGLKGRLIFEIPQQSSLAPTEVITLADSNPSKTMATPGNRASWDPADTYIGFDQPQAAVSLMQLAFGAPISLSEYVGTVPDGTHYLERLTAVGKVLKVPLQVTQISTGTVANSDTAGTLVISGGTSASYSFTGTYQNPLSCGLTALGDTSEIGPYWETITNTTLTANVKLPGTIAFSYLCWGHDLYVP
jgi:hypothetical protein